VVFELRNKIRGNSSYLNSEDVLTGIVFGNLRYFKNQDILIKFLNESIDINNKNKKLNLSSKTNLNINFWEKHFNDDSRRYNETDITLSNEKYMIIIECKYHSQLGEEYEIEEDRVKYYSNQLIRYSKILLDKKYKETEKIVIYLTMDKSIPKDILIKSRNDIDKIDKNIKLYWLSWNKLYL